MTPSSQEKEQSPIPGCFNERRSVGYRLGGATGEVGRPVPGGVVFEQAWAGVDVEMTEQAAGTKAVLWVESAEAAVGGFELVLALDGLVARPDGGHVWFVPDDDPAADPVLWMPHGWMVDSSADPRTGRPAYSDGVGFEVIERAGVTSVLVTVDPEWLGDPDRVFPVAVDPALAVTVDVADTYVTDGDNADHSAESSLWVGHDPVSEAASRAYVQISPGLWELPPELVDPLDQLDTDWLWFLADKVVLGGWYSHLRADCPTGPTEALGLYSVADPWQAQGLTWATQPDIGGQIGHLDGTLDEALAGILGLDTCANPADELVSWWVGDALIDTGQDPGDSWLRNGLMIGAPDETAGGLTELRATVGFDFAGMLVIWWSEFDGTLPPSEPTGVAPTGMVSTLEPTLSGTYEHRHPDAGRGRVLFTVTDPTGSLVAITATPLTYPGLPATTAVGTIDSVDFHTATGPIGTATTAPFEIAWDTTTLDDGTTEVWATVDLGPDGIWDTQPATVIVDNTTPGADRVQADYNRGLIDVDTYAEMLVRAVLALPGRPDRYQSPPADPTDPDGTEPSGSAHLAALWTYHYDNLDAATQTLIDTLAAGPTAGGPASGGLAAPSSHHGPALPDPNCLGASPVIVEGALEHELGNLDACRYLWEIGAGSGFRAEFLYRIDDPADDPAFAGTGVDPTPAGTGATVPQQVYEYSRTIEAAFETFALAGYDLDTWSAGDLTVEIRPLDNPNHLGNACCWHSDTRILRLNPARAEAPTVIHEVFHLVQYQHIQHQHATSDPTEEFARPESDDEFKWALESTARYAEAYYAGIPGTPLADLPTHIFRPPGFTGPDWWEPPAQTRVDPSLWQRPSMALTKEGPGTGWISTITETVAGTPRWATRRWYSGGIFWQHLAERVNDPTTDTDIVFEFWDRVADHAGTTSYFDDILDPILDNHDLTIPTAMRDLWVAIHLLTTDNNHIEPFAWQLPSSNPEHWRDSGPGQLGPHLPNGNAFGQDHRRLMAPSDQAFSPTIGNGRVVTPVSAAVPHTETGTVQAGGAWVLDIDIADADPGSFVVEVSSDDDDLAVTLVAYDTAGHPTICERDDEPVLDRRTGPGPLLIDVDTDCPTASLFIVNTSPQHHRIDFRATLRYHKAGTHIVEAIVDGPKLTGLSPNTWVLVWHRRSPLVTAGAGACFDAGFDAEGDPTDHDLVGVDVHYLDHIETITFLPAFPWWGTCFSFFDVPSDVSVVRIDPTQGTIHSWDFQTQRLGGE